MGKTRLDELELEDVAAIASTSPEAVTAAGTADVAATYTEAEVQAIQDLAASCKTQLNLTVTLVNEIKTQLNKILKG